jgi:hypothetical protein
VLLKAPHRPRSAGATTSRCTLSEPVPASSFGASTAFDAGVAEIGQHRLHALGIGTRRLGLRLRAAQLGSRDHLHGLGDLLRRLHAMRFRRSFKEGSEANLIS